ncbi:MAG: ATP-grasp domain-containing protein [Kineosporiaceae bacterium]
MPDNNLLLIGAGDEHYRGYALASLSARAAVHVVDPRSPGWFEPLAASVLRVPAPSPEADGEDDARRADAIVAAVRAGATPVSGVWTYDEFSVVTAAEVAQRLGVATSGPAVARRCRDKHLMREALAAAGVPSARHARVTGLAAALEAASAIGYPVVVKPVALAGSIGVALAADAEQLATAFAVASGSGHPVYGASGTTVLVEEYLDGPEVSVESVVDADGLHPVALTRKALGPAPFFEETGHVVAPGQPLPEQDAVLAVVRAAHEALGVTVGATHTELRLTPSGPRIVELALRTGGDLIPRLVHLATGVDLTAAAATAALGGRTGLPHDPAPALPTAPAAAVRFLQPDTDVTLAGLPELGDEPLPEGVVDVTWEVAAGQRLQLPPRAFLDRLGFAVAVGESAENCSAALDLLAARVRVPAAVAVPA